MAHGPKTDELPRVAPPAATGNAGPRFEAKVGVFYLLSTLSAGEPRGLPGAVTRSVHFQTLLELGKLFPSANALSPKVFSDGVGAMLSSLRGADLARRLSCRLQLHFRVWNLLHLSASSRRSPRTLDSAATAIPNCPMSVD
jgi:hypothetical protein